jgi:hypothetical protein
MMQSSLLAKSPNERHVPPMQFYSVEIMPLSDGRMSAGVGATFCETVDDDDFELVNMEMASAGVDTIDQALAVIREAVASTMAN